MKIIFGNFNSISFYISLFQIFLLHYTSVTEAHRLDGVMLTTGKDTRVFEKSIHSSLKYLKDVQNYYVITPDSVHLQDKLGKILGTYC